MKKWFTRKDPDHNKVRNLEKILPESDEQFSSQLDQSQASLSKSLRSEMLPSSDIKPDLAKFRFSRLNPVKIGYLLGFAIIIFMGWYVYAGAGRPVFEKVLRGLVSDNTPTQTPTAFIPNITQVVLSPTTTLPIINTPTRTPVQLQTSTATISVIMPSITPSMTSAPDCRDVLTVTMDDVGKTLCVRGIILNFEERESYFLIAFTSERGKLYWISYDGVWEAAIEGLCVELTAEVMQIANTPIMIFDVKNLPQICATP